MNSQFILPQFDPVRPRRDYLPEHELPTNRVAERPASCSLIELLAALLGGPRQLEMAETLVAHFGSLRAIHQAYPAEIAASVPGIGEQTALRLVAALELAGRMQVEQTERPQVHSPADAAALVQYEMGSLEQEHLRVILLDTRHRVMAIEEVYHGSLNSSLVRVGEIFRSAIRRNAAAILVVHNHPSGEAEPSPEDVAVTHAIVQAGKLIDIDCIDHLIIGHGRYVSMKERGLGFD